MKTTPTSIVCDKCGRSIKSNNVYGFSHPCSRRVREINEHFKKTIAFASNQEEVRKAREARAYANIMYNPSNKLKNLKRGGSER